MRVAREEEREGEPGSSSSSSSPRPSAASVPLLRSTRPCLALPPAMHGHTANPDSPQSQLALAQWSQRKWSVVAPPPSSSLPPSMSTPPRPPPHPSGPTARPPASLAATSDAQRARAHRPPGHPRPGTLLVLGDRVLNDHRPSSSPSSRPPTCIPCACTPRLPLEPVFTTKQPLSSQPRADPSLPSSRRVWVPDDRNGYLAGWVVKDNDDDGTSTVALEAGDEVSPARPLLGPHARLVVLPCSSLGRLQRG